MYAMQGWENAVLPTTVVMGEGEQLVALLSASWHGVNAAATCIWLSTPVCLHNTQNVRQSHLKVMMKKISTAKPLPPLVCSDCTTTWAAEDAGSFFQCLLVMHQQLFNQSCVAAGLCEDLCTRPC